MEKNKTTHIEEIIKDLTEYETYWFLIQLRNYFGCCIDPLETNTKHLKVKILSYAESHRITYTKAKSLMSNMIEDMVPINEVRWFYKRDRETLFILMVLKNYNVKFTPINTRNNVDISTIELIYGNKILKENNNDSLPYDPFIGKKIKEDKISKLKDTFDIVKVNTKDFKWLKKENKKQIEWAYNYKLRLKNGEEDTLPESILSCSDFIDINESYTDLMYDHIISSFDYYLYTKICNQKNELSLSQEDLTTNDKVIADAKAQRDKIIIRMRNAWYKKSSNKSTKTDPSIKYGISAESCKILKEMAKNQKKSEVELLEYIIKDYAKSNRFKGIF